MSFRVKTILLLTFLSIAPYVVTMIFLGSVYRADFEERLRSDMEYQLGITVDRLDQSLRSLFNDLRFIGSLDIMNDVLTADLDRRITRLVVQKKEDLQLIGDFDVTDAQGTIVASSDIGRVGQEESGERFMTVPLHSTFDDSRIGELDVHYDLGNLARLFANDAHLHYHLIAPGRPSPAEPGQARAITVERSLSRRPEISVRLDQDREFAFALLDRVTRSFYVALVIGTLAIATIAYVVASYIVAPILLLSSTARSITRTQDYGQRVAVARSDEIGNLAEAFNLMISGMQDMIARLREESENRLKLAQEKNRAEMLQSLSNKLSKYLSPQIFESIFSGERDVTLTSSRKKLTIFFSDIVNFTETTDQMESEDLTHLLNHYLSEMTGIALRYGATVDKYIGDAIMIFFGDPQSSGVGEDARLCVEMAIAMQRRVRELRAEWQAAGFTRPFSIRVGVHTGYCTVGNFGTESRMDYTIIGSAVNLASRIETSADPGSICMSEDTWLLVRDAFHCVPASAVSVKGVNQPVQLYKVLIEEGEDGPVVVRDRGFELKFSPRELTPESKDELKRALDEIARNL